MLVIIEGYKKETGKLQFVYAMNDCNFGFNELGVMVANDTRGYTTEACKERQMFYEFRVYKNCNDEKPLYRVLLSESGVLLRERAFDEE